jgi:tripartite-type tricarboxylate transporter receptor subunit TctC
MLGWKEAFSRPADGYTVILGSWGPVVAWATEPVQAPIDPTAVKVASIFTVAHFFVFSQPDQPWATWDGFMDYINQKGYGKTIDKLSMGQVMGSLAVALFVFDQMDIMDKIRIVTYDSTADAAADLLGGHIHLLPTTIASVASYLPDKVTPILALSDIENPDRDQFRDIPRAVNMGYKAMSTSRYIAFPPGVPEEILDKWSEWTEKFLEHKTVKKMFREGGLPIKYIPRAEASRQVKSSMQAHKEFIPKLFK